jgi:malonyl CoA-acyl carrier protein transacylase
MLENKPIAVVAFGAILPDAPDAASFWQNILNSTYSISKVPEIRWQSDLYYDPDPQASDKTYSEIGGFVKSYEFEPLKWRIPIPPMVQQSMDHPQKWAIATTRQLLTHYGAPERDFDRDRTAVILGNALAGERHYTTTLRIRLPEFLQALESTSSFQSLSAETQQAMLAEAAERFNSEKPAITEDTMPGELSNIIAGRIANVFNFRGPNFVTDAACASSFAALEAAVDGLRAHKFNAAVTGGIDSGMGVEAFVKFSKIGALSPDGSRPYDAGANGFVMGEGGAIFLLKRLEDAERDGDQIYAVIRGIGGSSDGKGKGITAPNPIGQIKAVQRAWQNAGVNPASVGLIEGHGTSTRVGDVVEVNCLEEVFSEFGLPTHSVALGSVKSNIGHLKSAAGAAGMLKTVLALHEKTLPPSANFHDPNPNINFGQIPFYVNTQVQPWEKQPGEIRRAGVSAFGFGGTNFHVVLEEYVPGLAIGEPKVFQAVEPEKAVVPGPAGGIVPVRAALDDAAVKTYILDVVSEKTGYPVEMLDPALDLEADLGIDTVKQAELFAAIREHYGIPRGEDLILSDYNTLEKVFAFVSEKSSETEIQTPDEIPAAMAVKEQAPPSLDEEAVMPFLLDLVSEKTGYPQDMLDLDLDLEADLGIDTVKQAELFATIREHYGIPRREDLILADYNTLRKVVAFVLENSNGETSPETAEKTEPVEEETATVPAPVSSSDKPVRNLLFLSAESKADLIHALHDAVEAAKSGDIPERVFPEPEAVALPQRIAIDFDDAPNLVSKAEKALKAMDSDNGKIWFALAAQGVRYGTGDPGKLVFMFPGQGSQYVNMLRDLLDLSPEVRDTFDEADAVMTPIFGRPLTDYVFVDGDEAAEAKAKEALRDTTITQPAVLTCNVALTRMLKSFGYQPDMVVGHSLGEYAALVESGILSFSNALKVVSARGKEMSKVAMADNGCMAAVTAPIEQVRQTLEGIDGYVVLANINSPNQAVIGGATVAVDRALAVFDEAGIRAVKIPVSHAFHTKIVEPASQPLRTVIDRMEINPPNLPIVANVTGDWYPTGREAILDVLADQVASPVQFIACMETLYAGGGRTFIEVGPKRVLSTLAVEIFDGLEDVQISSLNHPRKGGLVSFNEALCTLLAAGIAPHTERGGDQAGDSSAEMKEVTIQSEVQATGEPQVNAEPANGKLTGSVVISGTGLGLPGKHKKVFAEDNTERLLNGEILIDPLSEETRENMLDKHVVRLVKSASGAQIIELDDVEQTVKLAGQRGAFNLAEEFGVDESRAETFDIATQLAFAAGIDALREAGIPLVMQYKRTTVGTYLPDRWMLPQALRDETGVIFASAFPGLDRMAEESDRYFEFKSRQQALQNYRDVLALLDETQVTARQVITARIQALEEELAEMDYHFDRKFVFQVLAMGHSQFAEFIGARGPNTQVNGACASTTMAVGLAEDWIRAGRCRRVVVIAGDDVASGHLVNWMGTALMATGATTIEGDLRKAALPFDKRRNGMIFGMGAAALVVEAQDAVSERGMSGIAELIGSEITNSAFHGTRLDVSHVGMIMDRLLSQAEERFGIERAEIASKLVFVSHETYTPARGGSAAAEIHALRHAFGNRANQVLVANTKGYTGHSMGVGIEDVLAVKALQSGRVPAVANLDDEFEPDPELGDLKLSRGGKVDPDYALRLGAGFGSQLAMTLLRRIPAQSARKNEGVYQNWLDSIAGYSHSTLEVEKHALRIADQGQPELTPVVSNWSFGEGPKGWAAKPDENVPEELSLETGESSLVEVRLSDVREDSSDERTPVVEVLEVDPVKAYCVNLVSEKTGYPTEMLDLDLDLEADLGIDTVKQAELFAELREHYQLARREDLRLSDYNTLRKVIEFMKQTTSSNTTAEPAQPVQPPVTEVAPESELDKQDLDEEAVSAFILDLVSEKTGYPQEMLDLVLDLEADLGIDTVKQAELFATIREHYGIPRREDLILADYNTLTKVIKFVMTSITAPNEQDKVTPENEDVVDETQLEQTLTRRVPRPVLRPKLDLCLPTGVELSSEDTVLLIGEESSLTRAFEAQFAAMQVKAIVHSPDDAIEGNEEGSVKGAFFLAGLTKLDQIESLSLQELQTQLDRQVYALHRLMRSLKDLQFLIAVTQSDGLHGYGGASMDLSLNGGIAGFCKSLAREDDSILVKVLDFEQDTDPARMAEKAVSEVGVDPAVVEVGWHGKERMTIVALPEERSEGQDLALGAGTVFLISGGAGGISVPITRDLAERTQGSFILLGRTALPNEDDPYCKQALADRAGLKQRLIAEAAQYEQKITPVQIEKQLNKFEQQGRILQVLDGIRSVGAQVEYIACDVTDQKAVQQTLSYIKDSYGKVDVFIHAAGIEKSRTLSRKPAEEFRQVVEVKVLGFYNLYHEMLAQEVSPKAVQVFSSVAGRFGNPGQTDYAAANDTLCRWMVSLNEAHPETKFQALDWSAWAEVGMATRGFIPRAMAQTGIEMLPTEVAAPQVWLELTRGNSGEVILAGSLGVLEEQPENDGGMDVPKANAELRAGDLIHTMFSELTGLDFREGISLEADLDPKNESFLHDHELNGVPVLPGVMGIEGFTVAARHIASVLGTEGPGFNISTLRQIRFETPLKFYRDEPRHIIWKAQVVHQNHEMVADVTLSSTLKTKLGEMKTTGHFSGQVVLEPTPILQPDNWQTVPEWGHDSILSKEEIYQIYFHGPSFQVLEGVQRRDECVLGKLQPDFTPGSNHLMQLTSHPILIELCFQTAGVYEIGTTGQMRLPQSVGALKIYPNQVNSRDFYALVKPRTVLDDEVVFDAWVIDQDGKIYLEIRDYRTVQLPNKLDASLVTPFKKVLGV